MEDVLALYLRWFQRWSTSPFGCWLSRQPRAVQWIVKGAAAVVGYFIAVLLCAIVMALFRGLGR